MHLITKVFWPFFFLLTFNIDKNTDVCEVYVYNKVVSPVFLCAKYNI
jgi:hypothetical protein